MKSRRLWSVIALAVGVAGSIEQAAVPLIVTLPALSLPTKPL